MAHFIHLKFMVVAKSVKCFGQQASLVEETEQPKSFVCGLEYLIILGTSSLALSSVYMCIIIASGMQ